MFRRARALLRPLLCPRGLHVKCSESNIVCLAAVFVFFFSSPDSTFQEMACHETGGQTEVREDRESILRLGGIVRGMFDRTEPRLPPDVSLKCSRFHCGFALKGEVEGEPSVHLSMMSSSVHFFRPRQVHKYKSGPF